jgi:HlyD family secretion protein
MKTSSAPAFRSVKADEFLPPISRWMTLSGVMLMAVVGSAIALATFVKYNTTVKAAAMVRPQGEVRVVQTELEGTIEGIEVEVHQSVRQGDVIARLDRSRLESQYRQLTEVIQQAETQLMQLTAQTRWLETQMAAEGRSLDREVAVAQSELTLNQQTYQEQQQTRQADLAEAEAALAFAQREMQRYQQLASSGAVSHLQLDEKQAAVQAAAAQVARARAASNPSAASVAIAQTRIAQEQARGQATLAALQQELGALGQQQAELQAQLLQNQNERRQVEQDLQRTIIRATSDGIILRLNLRNPDQFVRSGDTIAAIVPNQQAFVIHARVSTQDINHIALGQRAQLYIHACPYPDYGTLAAKVMAIAPDAVTLPATEEIATSSTQPVNTPSRYFEITLQPQETTLFAGDRSCPLQAGMEVEANIISRQETLLQLIWRKARLSTGV